MCGMKLDLNTLTQNYNGLLVFGDLHGDAVKLEKLKNLALDKQLFLFSLGDLVDYGPDSPGVVGLFSYMFKRNQAHLVMGNHEIKFEKYIKQRRAGKILVQVKGGLVSTVNQFNSLPHNEMLDLEDKFLEFTQAHYHFAVFGKNLFTHGAVHKRYWEGSQDKRVIDLAVYAEVDRTQPMREDGYPNRTYDWVQFVPEGMNVVVGHDVRSTASPVIANSPLGGKVVFLDVGNSKGGKLFAQHYDKNATLVDEFEV